MAEEKQAEPFCEPSKSICVELGLTDQRPGSNRKSMVRLVSFLSRRKLATVEPGMISRGSVSDTGAGVCVWTRGEGLYMLREERGCGVYIYSTACVLLRRRCRSQVANRQIVDSLVVPGEEPCQFTRCSTQVR